MTYTIKLGNNNIIRIHYLNNGITEVGFIINTDLYLNVNLSNLKRFINNLIKLYKPEIIINDFNKHKLYIYFNKCRLYLKGTTISNFTEVK